MGSRALAHLRGSFFERTVLGIPLADRPAVLGGIVLTLVGLQFITVGLLAELQSRTYHESQDKPIYEVRHIHGQAS